MERFIKYYVKQGMDLWSWRFILNYTMEKTLFVEFNQVTRNPMPKHLQWMEKHSVNSISTFKIYKQGSQQRFELVPVMKEYLYRQYFDDWKDGHFTDLSLLDKEGKELLTVISSKNYIIMLLTDQECKMLEGKDIKFDCEWSSLEDAEKFYSRRDKKSMWSSVITLLEIFSD
ncbi:hypothetical protein [Fulvivirga ligni]|uniref:hypothetical protein n=1 Tax=Fulvivirga ligni TaxID=2904246 RepID=UPI001F1B396B|nr:hypothetical protein [Fulvivirga ligni]UII19766.1 hypothetical protein LVD16_18140 [Fulvivirga ligni]